MKAGAMGRLTTVLMAGLMLFGASAAHGSLVMYDLFDSYTPGYKTLSNSIGNWSIVGTGSEETDARVVQVMADAGNWFGQGTANQIVRIRDDNSVSSTLSFRQTDTLNPPDGYEVLTVSFLLYEPSGDGFNGGIDLRFGVSTLSSTNLGGADRVQQRHGNREIERVHDERRPPLRFGDQQPCVG